MSECLLDQHRTVPQEAVAAPIAVAEDVARDGHHLASLLQREARGLQRSAPGGGFDDDHGEERPLIRRLRRGK